VPSRPPIIPVSDYDESINMLVYGHSGVGKTVFAGSGSDTLLIGVESGLISAKRQGSTAKAWPVKSWDDVERAYEYLRDTPNHGFRWVGIDSITDMQEKLLRWILDKAVAESRQTRDMDIPAIQDHQKWQNMLKRFVNYFNDLPVNVLWTALEMKRESEEGEDIVLPLLLGKDYEISQIICGKMHVIGHMSDRVIKKGETEDIQRRIQFSHVPPYFAKDRYNCLPRYMLNPTLPKVESLIVNSGGLKKKSAPVRTRRTVSTRRRATRNA
jgi:AAA domain